MSQNTDGDENAERLAKAITEAREARGWSKRDLAMHAGLSQATIRSFEGRGGAGTAHAQGAVERALGWAPGSVGAILVSRSGDSPRTVFESNPVSPSSTLDAPAGP